MDTYSNAQWRVSLESLALISVSGKDSADFLQGQLSNDVMALNVEHPVQLSSYSTARGRVFAVVLLAWRAEHEYLMVLPKAGAEDVLNRLRMFVLRSKVTLGLMADGHLEGLSGDALDTLEPAPAADTPWAARWLDRTRLAVRWPDPVPRALLVQLSTPPAAADADDGPWWEREISAGIPWIVAEATREEFVAQMLDLDLLAGISFDKGCYTGQEVIARTHYLGRVKRRLRRYALAAAADDGAVAPGRQIEAQGDDGQWQKAGTVVIGTSAEVLAVMQLDHTERPLRLAPEEAAATADTLLTPLALPR